MLWLYCHIFVAQRVRKCDNQINTPFVLTYSLPLGKKNVTNQNVEVTNAHRSLTKILNIVQIEMLEKCSHFKYRIRCYKPMSRVCERLLKRYCHSLFEAAADDLTIPIFK